jgi:hypothetical protein
MLRRVALERTDVFLCSVLWLLVTAKIVPSSPILVTLMMEDIRSSETYVLTKSDTAYHARRRHSFVYMPVYRTFHICKRHLIMGKAEGKVQGLDKE